MTYPEWWRDEPCEATATYRQVRQGANSREMRLCFRLLGLPRIFSCLNFGGICLGYENERNFENEKSTFYIRVRY